MKFNDTQTSHNNEQSSYINYSVLNPFPSSGHLNCEEEDGSTGRAVGPNQAFAPSPLGDAPDRAGCAWVTQRPFAHTWLNRQGPSPPLLPLDLLPWAEQLSLCLLHAPTVLWPGGLGLEGAAQLGGGSGRPFAPAAPSPHPTLCPCPDASQHLN